MSETVYTTDVVETAPNAVEDTINAFKSGNLAIYSSFNSDDFTGKLKVIGAVTNSEPIADALGKQIDLVNYVVHEVTVKDKETGEIANVARLILIAADGSAYHAISTVMLNRLRDMVGVLGNPDSWPTPVPVFVSEERSGAYRYYDLRVAG